MSRSLRRGAIAALVIAAIVPLSACAAGVSPDTLQVKPDNASVSLGNDLKLNNIVVVTAPDASSDQAGPANVTVNISNTGSTNETLNTVTVGGANATFTDSTGAPLSGIVIPAGGAVLIGGAGQPAAHLSSVKVSIGGFTPTSFAFSPAGKVDATVPVVPAKDIYASFGPSAPVSASPSAGASASTSASATASTSASGAATPSGAASPAALVSPSSSATKH